MLRVGIVGLGLMGHSLVKACIDSGAASSIFGFDVSREHSSFVGQNSLITICSSLAQLAQNSDLIVLCVPIGAMSEVCEELAKHLLPNAVVTDIGSVKQEVLKAVRPHLSSQKFVAGHPIAGDAAIGPELSRANLFNGHWCILCPENTASEVVERVTDFWEGLGMKVRLMSSKEHDETLALTSHLPHLLSFGAAVAAAKLEHAAARSMTPFSAGSFRDITRIAGSNPDIWPDILLANREELVSATKSAISEFEAQIRLLEKGDREGLAAYIREANAAYYKIQDDRLAEHLKI